MTSDELDRERSASDKQDRLDRLRGFYNNTNTADTMADGKWETDVQDDPTVSITIQLPKSLLNWVRVEAENDDLRASALIRKWIEERRG